MKLVSFRSAGRASYGVVKDGRIGDIRAAAGERFPDLKTFIASPDWREHAERALADADQGIALEQAELLPVIPNPGKIMCVALNYHDHVAEANAHLPGGRETPTHPMMFMRLPETLVGHGADLVRPSVSHQLDYEAELLVVIGRDTPRHVAKERALEYVFGYSAMNEGSIRDYQFHSRNLTPGKNFEESGSIGPWIVTADEIPDPQQLDIEFSLNGETLQRANTADMIFSVADLIHYITQWVPLKTGDLIASGTMGGVGFTRKPPIFMKPGDRAEVRVSVIGNLCNGVRDEAPAGH